jgi:DNA helicase-2/ATP-dependent DNA helicase PcrA
MTDLFSSRYEKLNPAQKLAVDTIEGPVLVVAGPGSGKTELLSLRVANILRLTDTLPSAILCLTFTEAAASNMRSRLAGLIGQDAYKVAIHTFHGFANETINNYPQYFYNGNETADNIIQAEILDEALNVLPATSPLTDLLAARPHELLNQIKERISELKRAGLTPAQYADFLAANQRFLLVATPIIQEAFVDRISAKNSALYFQALSRLQQFGASPYTETLSASLDAASAGEKFKTPPLTEWKKLFLTKDEHQNIQFRDLLKHEHFLAVAQLYEAYQKALRTKGYLDFDDLLLELLAALQRHPDLKYDLQEKYLYILVDEFQDTNGIQNLLLEELQDFQFNEGRPNILAVGDDDQAIYKFQGAQLKNIIDFHGKYRDPALVVLTDNYRSHQHILDLAREVILPGEERLEQKIPTINKQLEAKNATIATSRILHLSFQDEIGELHFLAEEIAKLAKAGHPLEEIAVIATKHRTLEQIAKVLQHKKIPVNYGRQKNILDKKSLQELIILLRFLHTLVNRDHAPAEELLPEILGFPFLNFPRRAIWQLSVQAHKQKSDWLPLMLADPIFADFADFLIHLASEIHQQTAEQIIDYLTGESQLSGQRFHSPFKEYYFSAQQLAENPAEYLDHLDALKSFIQKIRSHKRKEVIYVKDLLNFVDLHQKYQIELNYQSSLYQAEKAVHLLTGHGAKGLEFTTVFLANLDDRTWTNAKRSTFSAFPATLNISREKDNIDDKRRLFYVALTRAKKNIYLLAPRQNERGDELLPLRFLADSEFAQAVPIENQQLASEISELFFTINRQPILDLGEKELLRPLVANYKLSATHLNNFLDLENAGPEKFIQEHLLRFPSAKKPHLSYGNAIHKALHYFLAEYKNLRERPSKERLQELYIQSLQGEPLNPKEYEIYANRGLKNLDSFYDQSDLQPQDQPEYDFSGEFVKIGDALITGKIDRLRVDEKNRTIIIYDYKASKPFFKWDGGDAHQAAKAWRYKNQLLFYKLLVENSRRFAGLRIDHGVIEFLEPANGKISSLILEIGQEDVHQMQRLIQAVYRHIVTLDFPDTTIYGSDFLATQQFVVDLANQ